MEKHVCNICSRRFINGKAMGGHMRSHLAKLPIPLKPFCNQSQETRQQLNQSNNLSPFSSSLHAKPQLNPMFVTSFEVISCSDEEESESGSSIRNSTKRKRSKRGKRKYRTESPDTAISVICDENDEDVARSLVMLSKDKWWGVKGKDKVPDSEEMDSTEDEDEDKLFDVKKRSRTIYRCETCKKVFNSYQALGGHRASHKKFRNRFEDDEQRTAMDEIGRQYHAKQRIFDCPFCDKIFESGQAMGGHKKIHFSNNARIKIRNASSSPIRNLIDLNLPAPEEVEVEDEDSTVSNAEVISNASD